LEDDQGILLQEAKQQPIADLAPQSPVFCFALVLLVPIDLGPFFLLGLTMDILK
jgi:hypothetical protein